MNRETYDTRLMRASIVKHIYLRDIDESPDYVAEYPIGHGEWYILPPLVKGSEFIPGEPFGSRLEALRAALRWATQPQDMMRIQAKLAEIE